MSRYPGGGGSSNSRRSAPAYQTSSSSRNYSSTGSSDRDYSRSHLSSNGGSSANYYSSSSSRKPESGTTGYSYLEPNWIEKTRSTLPVDPYASNYLDRAPVSTSRDYTTTAASQPVYPSAAAAALSVGGNYGSSSSMPKAYARPDDYYRTPTSALAPTADYGYQSAFEQSTMAAQAAAIYEMTANHHSKRDAWPASTTHVVDYNRRDDDRRGGERRREETRKDERRAVTESWRGREREVPRDRDRRPAVSTRERLRDDLRVPVSSSSSCRNEHREVARTDRPTVVSLVRTDRDRHQLTRDRDGRDTRDTRDTRDVSRRTDDKRELDRESRELERQLAKVQRELEQLESGGRSKGNSREKESDRSRRPPAPAVSSSIRRPPSPPRNRAKPGPPSRRVPPPPRSGVNISSSIYHRNTALRPTRYAGGRPSALPSLLDTVVPRPGRRPAPLMTRTSRPVWEMGVRRGVTLSRPSVTKRIAGYAAKRTTTRGRTETITSREKVRRAKEKMRREDERKRRMEKRKEGRDERSQESREKRKEEDFAWLESIMSEDEELDEETNRKVLLAPRKRDVLAIVDRDAVHPHTLDNLDAKTDTVAVVDEEEETEMWTAEECEAIELLPIIDTMGSLASEVGAAFLAAHPDSVPQETVDSNGHEKMEE